MNNFSLEEEQSDKNYSRKLNLSFTDTAIDKVASVLGGYVPLTPLKVTKPASVLEQQAILPPFQQLEEEVDLNRYEDTKEQTINTTVQSSPETNTPANYFEIDGQGVLVSKTPDYKGKNKKLQQQRFSLLYVWAYNILCHEPVLKDYLNQAAKVNGIYDKNYTSYLNDLASRYFVKSDGTFKLNPGGQAEVKKIIAEMQDSDLKGNEYWSSSRKNSSKGSRKTKEDTQNIEQWIQMTSRFDSFDVRKLNTAVEYALLALYDITKELKAQDAVKPGLAYDYLVKKYKTVSVSQSNFSKALTNTKDYSKYFSRTSEGLYYLTPDAESFVEGWLI
ncbi:MULTISPECIES: hypothetical protein [Calothrix]|uniref:Uncharacterized protein n=2 Tax=Calothrix TaxID=1186 RepID=A0ABR8ABU6_9CYAN|nr:MULTISPECIES: hypothetical protein [Calothrix]MBD2197466.1 hypothetical protein [Calothrix parietina FACHB-288]MBD2226033.1 hypothetical protein [Calothrix anomala FACHB-343]